MPSSRTGTVGAATKEKAEVGQSCILALRSKASRVSTIPLTGVCLPLASVSFALFLGVGSLRGPSLHSVLSTCELTGRISLFPAITGSMRPRVSISGGPPEHGRPRTPRLSLKPSGSPPPRGLEGLGQSNFGQIRGKSQRPHWACLNGPLRKCFHLLGAPHHDRAGC